MDAESYTFAECEDQVEEMTKVPESPEEEARAAQTILNGVSPQLEGLRQMRWGLSNLKKSRFKCSGRCRDHECMGKGEHQGQIESTFGPLIKSLEAEVEQLKREVTHWLYKYMNCRCPSCLTQGKVNAAPFN